MSDPMLYPLTFTPVLRDYLWGGRRLETLFGRRLPPGIIAESWEISGHPSGSTVAEAGYWQGQPLPAIQEALGERLVGARGGWALARRKFPLLIKLLDARQDLSVQVHPDDAYALAHENGELGKTEMWYVLHADEGTELIRGLQPGVDRQMFLRAVAEGTLPALLRREPVRAGQVFDVPAGTVHALLAGAVVAEIQQNSDATYRIYDWGRVGADGRPRPLHIEKALEVIDFAGRGGQSVPCLLQDGAGLRRVEVVRNRYFVVETLHMDAGARFPAACDGATLEVWGCVAGRAAVEWEGGTVPLPAVRFALLPAALGAFAVTALEPCTCLRTYLPEA
jgi:mannose-6-phosphate isomerase